MMDEADPPAGVRLDERSEDGVDLTLIRWALSLTPAERLEMLDGYLEEIEQIRERNRVATELSDSQDTRYP
jgi:hypothetical protein